jgi:hypothetical protein
MQPIASGQLGCMCPCSLYNTNCSSTTISTTGPAKVVHTCKGGSQIAQQGGCGLVDRGVLVRLVVEHKLHKFDCALRYATIGDLSL